MSALIQFQSRNTKYSRNTDQIYFSYIIFENINAIVFTKNDDINFLAKKFPLQAKNVALRYNENGCSVLRKGAHEAKMCFLGKIMF